MSALDKLRTDGPDPAAESTALGEWLLECAGIEPRPGLVTVAPDRTLRRVPFARQADWIAWLDEGRVAVMGREHVTIEPGTNLADEERDSVVLDGATPERGDMVKADQLWLRAALIRAVLMAGALERISAMAIGHAGERRQFGRPIASFQSVQSHLVTTAQQAALVGIAADAAAAGQRPFEIAAAKTLAGRAAVIAGRAAHQVLGARGVTLEHPLSAETKRLWSWRSEYGDERHWAGRLGVAAAAAGPDRLYPAITAGGVELEV